jgi:hypothetical protein
MNRQVWQNGFKTSNPVELGQRIVKEVAKWFSDFKPSRVGTTDSKGSGKMVFRLQTQSSWDNGW